MTESARAGVDRDVPLTTLSPSRISIAQKCGLAFDYQYVRRVPAPTEAAAKIFGNVVHDALQEWYGPDDAPRDHKQTPLQQLVQQEWPKKLPKQIWAPTQKAIDADAECEALAAAIVASRGVKAPRQTKDFLTSAAWKHFTAAQDLLLDACDKYEGIRWAKDENPLQAYYKSLLAAERMQARWGQLPRPLAVERPFQLQFEGFTLRGRLDQFRVDPSPDGEALAELTDVKTGRSMHSQMEAFVQGWIYHKACEQMPDLPPEDYVTFYMARHDKPQRGKFEARHDQLALRILGHVARSIITASYEPHYGFWCTRCDFRDLCEREIGIWPSGSDGITLGLAAA